MSNPFYNYSGNFIPGTLARAETSQQEFQAVQAGFSLLVTEGVDSGVASAYVVTTNGQPTGAYADGNTVEFKPLFAPTGSATINVNSVGVVPLLRFNGSATQSGDFGAGQWLTATYNSLYSGFTIASPSAVVVYPGTISGAAPTHKVGLVAAGGVSTAAAPIDVTFAIDQSIVPTWTGAHTFSALVTANAGIVVSGGANNFAVNSSGDVVISASSGTALTITGAGSVASKVFQFNAGGSSIYGLMDTTNVSGAYIGLTISGTLDGIIGMGAVVITGAALADLCLTPNTGVLRLGYNNGAATALSINNTGTVVVAAPSSGAALTVNSVSGSSGLVVNQSGGSTAALTVAAAGSVTIAAPTAGVGLTVNSFSGSSGLVVNQSGGSTAALTVAAAGNVTIAAPTAGVGLTVNSFSGSSGLVVNQSGGSTAALTVAAAGSVTIAAPSSGVALAVNGLANANAMTVTAPNTASQAYGFVISAGTNSTDYAFYVRNAATSAVFCEILGDGSGHLGINATNTLSWNASGNYTIAAPSSGVALALTGFAGSSALTIATTGMQVGSPTGADEGAGTINVASGYYINGTSQFQTGTFTGTLTGCTTSPTATIRYVIVGNMCTLFFPTLTGTSNSTSATITGLPAVCQATTNAQAQPIATMEDSGNAGLGGYVQIQAASGTMILALAESTAISNRVEYVQAGFTNSGTKGLGGGSITYSLI